jgi:hypothetical protein
MQSLQLLDRLRPGWQSLAYYHDVVQLATAAGQQQQQQPSSGETQLPEVPIGSTVLEVGAALMLEKHSIFVER